VAPPQTNTSIATVWYGLGSSCTIWYSTDAINWTQSSLSLPNEICDVTPIYLPSANGWIFNTVEEIYFTPDLLRVFPFQTFNYTEYILSTYYSNIWGMILGAVVKNEYQLWVSKDGKSWNNQSLGPGYVTYFYPVDSQNLIVGINITQYATTVVASSNGGVDWNHIVELNLEYETNYFYWTNNSETLLLLSILGYSGEDVATYSVPLNQVTNPRSWTTSNIPSFKHFNQIVVYQDIFILFQSRLVCDSFCTLSRDGIEWFQESGTKFNEIKNIATDGNKLLGFGLNGFVANGYFNSSYQD